jgi:hypothetical protein
MTKSEIRYQIFTSMADTDFILEHCEQGRRTPGVSRVWIDVYQTVFAELLPVWQSANAAIDRELEWD